MTVDRPRVGLFGLLGSGNIGNDASLESVLAYLRGSHPEAILDAMCMGPEQVRGSYGIEAIPLFWYQQHAGRATGVAGLALKVAGKLLDTVRTAAWVRRHDAVIVPGMGVLEATLPLRATGVPYSMFLLCLSGRLFGTKVALVSVGANVMQQRLTRWLFASAARLACYRSYRDAASREALSSMRVNTAHDRVYPDLAFAIPASPGAPGDPQVVGVGVMDFRGNNDERRQATEIYRSYVEAMTDFVVWLADNGRQIRLFVGDTIGCDDRVIKEILTALRLRRPALDRSVAVAVPLVTFADVMREMQATGTVVAARYHNIICALRLCKPTLAISYATKHYALLADIGMSEFCQPARDLDAGSLIDTFIDLENKSAQLRRIIAEYNAAAAQRLAEQFGYLSATLFPADVASAAQPVAAADFEGIR